MSYCLNPLCQAPRNSDQAKFCQSCGMTLRLSDRYRALQPIGSGGFGKTFLAVDEYVPSKRRCVIKQFAPSNLGGDRLEKATALFHQEAMQLDHLGQHPQIPQLLAHFTQPPYHYLVQSYVDGYNLEQELIRGGAFSEAQITEVLANLLPVLQFIHDRQVIHRDIKPANIIRRRSDRQLVLVDFGASKFASETNLLNPGTVIGSAGYSSPEQASGKAVFASDLYSLGVTCLHLLTQTSPLDLYSFGDGTWIWRSYLSNPIAQELGEFLDRLVYPALNQRFSSAAIALAALQSMDVHLCIPAPFSSAAAPPSTQPIPSVYASPSVTTELPAVLGPDTVQQPLVWRCVHTLHGHANSISSVAISPNGKLLASASFDRTIRLWHLGTGALISTYEGHLEPVMAVIFSPDGQALISGSVDDTIRLWDIGTESLLYILTNHVVSSMSLSVEISPDGQAIVSGSDDHTVRIWQLSSGRLLRTLLHPRAVTAVDISPNGEFLVSACNDNAVRVWNFSTGELVHTLVDHSRDVNAVVVSPDNQFLASGGSDNTLHVWNLRTGDVLQTIKGHLDWVRTVTISPNSQILASGSDDHTIKLWSLAEGRLLHTLAGYTDGHRRGVNAIAFSPDGRTLVSGSSDRTVKIWRYH